MENLPFVGVYTLNGCTYVMLKQTNDSNGGGELHFGMENFSALMALLKGLENELLRNQNPIGNTFNNTPYDPIVLLDGIFESATSSEQYNPAQPSIAYSPSSNIGAEIPKKTRKRRSDAGIKKKPHSDLTLTAEIDN